MADNTLRAGLQAPQPPGSALLCYLAQATCNAGLIVVAGGDRQRGEGEIDASLLCSALSTSDILLSHLAGWS